MNVWLTRTALRIRGLSPGARIVLLAHADACRPSSRTCLTGLEELAEACELSPKHVMRLRAQLVDAGHLRKLAGAHPGQRPVYEVLPAVPVPVPTSGSAEPDRVAASGRENARDGSRGCDPPYKPQGITPLPPSEHRTRATHQPWRGGRGGDAQPSPGRPGGRSNSPGISHPDAVALAQAAIAALRPDHRTRIDELGQRRLERAAHPLAGGWTPTDLATRIGPNGWTGRRT